MQSIKHALILIMALAVEGCSSSGTYRNVPVEDISSGSVFEPSDYPASQQGAGVIEHTSPVVSEPLPAVNAGAKPVNSAVASLLASAQGYRQQQDYMKASAALERAIRISPRDGELYYQLAQVRFLQANYPQAMQLCRKAISLAAGNESLIERSRTLQDRARVAQGG